MAGSYSNLIVLDAPLTKAEMCELWTLCDVFVSAPVYDGYSNAVFFGDMTRDGRLHPHQADDFLEHRGGFSTSRVICRLGGFALRRPLLLGLDAWLLFTLRTFAWRLRLPAPGFRSIASSSCAPAARFRTLGFVGAFV